MHILSYVPAPNIAQVVDTPFSLHGGSWRTTVWEVGTMGDCFRQPGIHIPAGYRRARPIKRQAHVCSINPCSPRRSPVPFVCQGARRLPRPVAKSTNS